MLVCLCLRSSPHVLFLTFPSPPPQTPQQALERSGMSYTIVRPGGMERPKDDYKASHNLVIKPRDSIFGGQVRRVQGFLSEWVAAPQ